ncbi:PepSY domain-containing protein [Streptomyces sp. NPDC002580]|uniref:PepSY domain-containing protein n=1 Tax=Streptomyces sp. NPDC002580 TaxID=3364653 RepID=UPI00369D1BF2
MKRNLVLATVAAAALIGGGTATALAVTGNDVPASADRSSARPGTHEARDTGSAAPTATAGGAGAAGRTTVAAKDAVVRALAHTPGTAVGAELEAEHGAVVWEVEIIDRAGAWHDVRVDPAGGEVLGSRTRHEEDAARIRAALAGASVPAARAAEAVAARGTVTSVDIDDDGTPAWDVETLTPNGTVREWRVDLTTGRVTPDDHGSHDTWDDGAHHGADDRSDDGADDRTAHGADDRRGRGSDDGSERGSDDDGAEHTASHGSGHGSHRDPGHGSGHGSDDGSRRGSDDD